MLALLVARRRLLTVPCCRECNSVLGASYQETAAERKDELKRRMRKRYEKILAMPNWTSGELAQLSPRMMEYVLTGLVLRDFIKERLQW